MAREHTHFKFKKYSKKCDLIEKSQQLAQMLRLYYFWQTFLVPVTRKTPTFNSKWLQNLECERKKYLFHLLNTFVHDHISTLVQKPGG